MTENIERREYLLKSNLGIVYNWFSEPYRLEWWFAEKVVHHNNSYVFFWDGDEFPAELVEKKKNKMLRFKWSQNPEQFFEFHFHQSLCTNEMIVEIIGQADPKTMQDSGLLWDMHIARLKSKLGA
jgi:hypothetical protein